MAPNISFASKKSGLVVKLIALVIFGACVCSKVEDLLELAIAFIALVISLVLVAVPTWPRCAPILFFRRLKIGSTNSQTQKTICWHYKISLVIFNLQIGVLWLTLRSCGPDLAAYHKRISSSEMMHSAVSSLTFSGLQGSFGFLLVWFLTVHFLWRIRPHTVACNTSLMPTYVISIFQSLPLALICCLVLSAWFPIFIVARAFD